MRTRKYSVCVFVFVREAVINDTKITIKCLLLWRTMDSITCKLMRIIRGKDIQQQTTSLLNSRRKGEVVKDTLLLIIVIQESKHQERLSLFFLLNLLAPVLFDCKPHCLGNHFIGSPY